MDNFTIVLRFAELQHEQWALREYYNIVEEQIDYLSQQLPIRLRASLEHKGLKWEDAEVQIGYQELHALIGGVLPRYFRGSVILILWAATETTLDDIANILQKQKGIKLSSKDIQGDTLDRFSKYFEHVLNYPLDKQSDAWTQLRELQTIRNCLAHFNGRLSLVRPDTQKRLKKIAQKNQGVDFIEDRIKLSKEFIANTTNLILKWLEDLTDSVQKDFSLEMKIDLSSFRNPEK